MILTDPNSIMSEAELQDSVVKMAIDLGWMFFHPVWSRKSEPGFPDLVLVKPPRLIFAELKREKGKLTKGRWNKAKTRWLPGQDEWAEALEACPGAEYYLWKPSDLNELTETLMRPSRGG